MLQSREIAVSENSIICFLFHVYLILLMSPGTLLLDIVYWSDDNAPHMLNVSTRWAMVTSFMFKLLYLTETVPITHWTEGWVDTLFYQDYCSLKVSTTWRETSRRAQWKTVSYCYSSLPSLQPLSSCLQQQPSSDHNFSFASSSGIPLLWRTMLNCYVH